MNRFLLFATFGAVILLISVSCTKNKLSKLEQTWQMIDISSALPQGTRELWDFNDGKFFRIRTSTASVQDTIDTGYYEMKSGALKTTVKLSDCKDEGYNNDWKVNTLKKDILVLVNLGDEFMYKEFKKFE
jgi:hypothetical protein